MGIILAAQALSYVKKTYWNSCLHNKNRLLKSRIYTEYASRDSGY